MQPIKGKCYGSDPVVISLSSIGKHIIPRVNLASPGGNLGNYKALWWLFMELSFGTPPGGHALNRPLVVIRQLTGSQCRYSTGTQCTGSQCSSSTGTQCNSRVWYGWTLAAENCPVDTGGSENHPPGGAGVDYSWYNVFPYTTSLQLTHFQSLISLRMNHIIFREDPKSH